MASLSEYKGCGYLRTFLGAPPKAGKTTLALSLVEGSAGRVVDSPQNLHMISCDPGGLSSLLEHQAKYPWIKDITEEKASDGSSFEELANNSDISPNPKFYRELMGTFERIRQKYQDGGNGALFISGASALILGLNREVRFTRQRRNSVDPLLESLEMDEFRWTIFGNVVDAVRAKAHAIKAHVIWEFQITKWVADHVGSAPVQESALIQGRQATLFPAACEQGLKVVQKIGNPNVRVLDTRPNWAFMRTSRLETRLPPIIEPADLSVIVHSLGLPMAERKVIK